MMVSVTANMQDGASSCAAFKATILIIVAAACFSSAIVSPCLPFIADYFNVHDYQTSLLVSNFLFGYLAGQVFYSILSQRSGYKVALIFGFLIYVSSCLIQIIAINCKAFNLLYYARFGCAFGASSGLICVFAIINDLPESKIQTQKLVSLAFISLTFFSYLSITIGGLLTQYLGWIYVFYFMMIVSLLNLLVIFKYIPQTYRKQRRHKSSVEILSQYFKAIFNYKIIIPSLAVSFTTTGTYLYNAIASTLSKVVFHLSPSVFGVISILNLIGLIFGGWLSSNLIIKYKTSSVLLCGMYIAFFPVAALFFLHDIIFTAHHHGLFFFLMVFILNFGLGIIYPSASFLALNALNCSSTASSIMNFLKIASPAFAIYFVSKSRMELITSYRVPLASIFIVAMLSCFAIKIIERLKSA
ncbi:MAG: MFS transporter [Tatlockia sp.]|jgi:MFS family permease